MISSPKVRDEPVTRVGKKKKKEKKRGNPDEARVEM
jgi:hypothetical protein